MFFPNKSIERIIKTQSLQKVLASELSARLWFTRKPYNKGALFMQGSVVCRISVKIPIDRKIRSGELDLANAFES